MINNKIKIIIGVVSTLILLLGGTYALISFLTDTTDVNMTVDGDRITFDAGTNITVDGLLPVYSMYSDTDVITKDIEIYKENGDYTAGINLYLNLKTWPSAMSSASFRWALYKNGDYLSSGDFSGKSQGNNIKLTSSTQAINLVENKDTYKLYMWIDAYQESNINMMNQSFTVGLYGQTTFYDDEEDPIINEIEPNAPDLAEGMIPIKYNYVIDEWVKADTANTNNDWYDYYNKMWANAVTVTTDKREKYMNADVGTTVSEDDILTYYVWIPRYKYLLFNANFQSINPVEIQIEFQKETDEIFNGTENGEYLTHPAFWWDNNGDGIRDAGEELSGIWVGKFETTGTYANPTIKPNVRPLVALYFGTRFNLSKKLNSSNYLTSTGSVESDSHMMKNLEWGAVAYLSHSKYGKNNEVSPARAYSTYITGARGNYTYNDFYIKDGKISSSKSVGPGIAGSTTGNVYGIYGMSGGVTDIVSAGADETFSADTKYYDFYERASSGNDYSISKLGDAIGETWGWYGDSADTVYSTDSRLKYGRGSDSQSSPAGIFTFGRHHGYAYDNEGSRAVLVLP